MSTLYVDNIYSKTGTAQALTIDSSGRILTPNKPMILAQGNVEGNVVYAANDPISNWKTSGSGAFAQGITIASNTRFTVPVDGKYWFSATVYYNDNNSSCRLQIKQNGSYNNPNGQLLQSGDPNNRSLSVTTILNLSANDYIEICNASTGSRTIYNGAQHTYVSMYLLG